MAKCPTCSKPLPFAAMAWHGALLGGPYWRVRCPGCHHYVYVVRDMRSVLPPLLILALAFVVSFPSPISSRLLSDLGSWMPIARAEIWAIAIFLAIALFSFGGRLSAVASDQPRPRISTGSRLINLVFQIVMVVWVFRIWWGLMDRVPT